MDHGALRTKALNHLPRKALHAAGWLLSLVALAIFVRLAWKSGLHMPDRSTGDIVATLGLGSIAYAMLVCLLAAIWVLLADSGRPFTPRDRLLIAASHLTSQFAKYLPGNVLQYVARHVLGRRLGLTHGMLASAAIVEAALLASAALTLVIAFGMPVLNALDRRIPVIPTWLASLCILAPIVISTASRVRFLSPWVPVYPVRRLFPALLGYLVFFLGFGSIFHMLVDWTSPSNYIAPAATSLIGGAGAAWLVGFLIPGAPAGVGLRETALALAIGSASPPTGILSAIVLFRLVTLGGDFLSFLAGWLLLRKLGPGDEPKKEPTIA